jgi:hypothetical protein
VVVTPSQGWRAVGVLGGGSKSGHRRISRHRGEGRPTAEAPPRLQVTDGVTCGARDVEDERCLSQTISNCRR